MICDDCLIQFPEIIEALGPLYQLMDSRVNMLSRLSKLKGKVDIMLSQVRSHSTAGWASCSYL